MASRARGGGARGAIGTAVASCFPHVERAEGLAPGVGAVVAQGIGHPEGRDELIRLLVAGAPEAPSPRP